MLEWSELTLLRGAASAGLLAKYSSRWKSEKCFIFKLLGKHWTWSGCYSEVIFKHWCLVETFFLPSLLVWFRNVFLHEPCMSPLPSPGVLCRMDSVQGLSSFPVNTDVKMGSHCLPGSHCSQCEGPDQCWSDWEGPEGLRCGVWCSAPPVSLPRPALSHCTAHWQCLFCWSPGLLFTTGLKAEPVFQGLLEIPSQM